MATVPGALLSRTWRNALREISWLSALLNVLALAYVVPLLLASALFVLAGVLAPANVPGRGNTPEPVEA